MIRRRIAVITARADAQEQKEILGGIAEAAFAANTDVAVYSNIYNHWLTDEQITFENIIYQLFEPHHFHGAIITAEAFMDIHILDTVIQKLRKEKLPTVVIGKSIKGFDSIFSDDAKDTEALTDHLLSVHHFTDIDFLTGPKDNPVSNQRILGCQRAFEKKHLCFDETKVHYGNFWDDSGKTLAQQYLDGEFPLPQAVVCTNNHMAFGLCDALTTAGISIPEQVTVVGYDYTGGRIYHYPILTAYHRNRRKMGIDAVNKLLGTEYPTAESDRFISGNSCSCGATPKQLTDEMHWERINQYHTIASSVAQFSGQLTLCRTLAEYTSVLKEFFYLLHGVKTFYLCLDKAWNSHSYEGTDFICCKVNEEQAERTPETIRGSVLFPALTQNNESPVIIYFSPVHFQTRLFGYTALEYNYPAGYDFSFRDFNKSVANTLEFLRMKNDISYLTQCQRASSLYDALTGFYNLREFKQIITTAEEYCSIQAIKLNFFDNGEILYGENYRNDIVSAVAKSIKQACTNHEICCRAREDIFLILYKTSDTDFINRLRIMLHHAMCGNYTKEQVLLSFETHNGIREDSVELLCRKADRQATQDTAKLELRKKYPHYSTLLNLRSSIMTAPKKAPTLEEVSRNMCVSEGHFRSIYKQCFDVSYQQDCINFKLMKACYLLYTTSMSIYAIAVNCGYTDEKYFARQFKQNLGCSPMQYRKKISR